jgi:hypothetical protein
LNPPVADRGSLSVVNTSDLAALVPGQMARHPSFEWTIPSGRIPEEDLVVELHPRGWPERVATVQGTVKPHSPYDGLDPASSNRGLVKF